MGSRPEDERVKIPALVHLTRLKYQYTPWTGKNIDGDTNIFIDEFRAALSKINSVDVTDADVHNIIETLKTALDNDDLGREFFGYLQKGCLGLKLIDFTTASNNTWQVVTEYTCRNGQDEFRPDITLLINGLPLVFIEVKRPNNKDGIQAERDRILCRMTAAKRHRRGYDIQGMRWNPPGVAIAGWCLHRGEQSPVSACNVISLLRGRAATRGGCGYQRGILHSGITVFSRHAHTGIYLSTLSPQRSNPPVTLNPMISFL